eukprot:PhF_6_TR23865/c0_g1_i1/m.33446
MDSKTPTSPESTASKKRRRISLIRALISGLVCVGLILGILYHEWGTTETFAIKSSEKEPITGQSVFEFTLHETSQEGSVTIDDIVLDFDTTAKCGKNALNVTLSIVYCHGSVLFRKNFQTTPPKHVVEFLDEITLHCSEDADDDDDTTTPAKIIVKNENPKATLFSSSCAFVVSVQLEYTILSHTPTAMFGLIAGSWFFAYCMAMIFDSRGHEIIIPRTMITSPTKSEASERSPESTPGSSSKWNHD